MYGLGEAANTSDICPISLMWVDKKMVLTLLRDFELVHSYLSLLHLLKKHNLLQQDRIFISYS